MKESRLIYEELRKCHEHLGLYAQVLLIKKALELRFDPSTGFSKTISELTDLHTQIMNMGPMDPDNLKCVFLINTLGDQFSSLQSSIQSMSEDANFSSSSIVKRLHAEESLLRRRGELGLQPEALAAIGKTRKPGNLLCTHCKRTNHLTDYCIHPGGKMAGKTVEEAHTAQRAALSKPGRTQQTPSAHVAAVADAAKPSPPKTNPTGTPIIYNGVSYYPGPTSTPSTVVDTAVYACDEPSSIGDYGYHAYAAIEEVQEDPKASLNWATHSRPIDLLQPVEPPSAYTAGRSLPVNLDKSPFIFDTGATVHISPERSDFQTWTAIPPRPVKGLGGSSIFATGIGSIDLSIASGHKLLLQNVLYIPGSTVRLVSVLSLNRDNAYTSHFGDNSCWITDKHGTTVARGSVSASRNLFTLDCSSPRITHSRQTCPPPPTPIAMYASRIPNIETWHRRLGHCNTRTIIDMARSCVVEGMKVDLSISPPKCDLCILGKQTRSPVPSVREGNKAVKPLERVFVDLCGPMPVKSRSGRLYSMNLIDDFSSYVWSLPLRSKDEAAPVLQAWHRAVTNQSGARLKILVTDNGELMSNAMSEWCSLHGIDHQLTAPYTSAQNGRAERLHRTLLNKARTMRLACNAPPNLWDEFCATAAYLTNFTASTSINGRTPYELWHSQPPSLSHLREIGCRAYALIPTNNPKLFQRSTPCVLIGYVPHAKAYRLWDTSNGRIFNSFHVSFLEHLDTLPVPLLPGKSSAGDPSTPPTWNTSSPQLPDPSPPNHPFINPHTSSPNAPLSATFSVNPPQLPNHSPLPHPSQIPNQSSSTTPNPPPRPPSPHTPASHRSTPAVPDPPAPRPPSPDPPTAPRPPTPRLPSPEPPTPPSPPKLRRSVRLAALQAPRDHSDAFLSKFCAVRDSHDLLPAELCLDTVLTIPEILAALSDGNISPSLDTGDDPTWAEAINSPEREYWIAGGHEELKSLEDLKVFILVPKSDIPSGQRPLKGKLVCKRKRDDLGNIVRYKVRYIAKGFAQQYGIDYDKTTAPTIRLESFRAILHLAATLNWDLQHFDVKTAFLHSILPPDETMFMEQPHGFESPGKEDWVMRLMKSLYGMKQASRIWNQTFHKTVEQWGFQRMPCEWCVYKRQSATGTIIFAVHVDDIVSAASSPAENARFKTELSSQWQISDLGQAKYALGISITRHLPTRTISISQTAFIDRVVECFNIHSAHTVDTPMVGGLCLHSPDKTIPLTPDLASWVERTPYAALVGSLMYIAVGTRPDITYAVGHLASFLDCYRPEHWDATIRVVRYLKGTRTLCLVLGGTTSMRLLGYSDSDYANCPDTSRSISGYCFTLGSGMISWSSRKQKTVADSSCYAEYIALHEAAHEAIFLRQLLSGLHILPSGTTPLHCDNDAASKLAEDHVWHSRTKHIRVKYHYIREQVLTGDLNVTRVRSHDNTADILTKPLNRPDFLHLRQYLHQQNVKPLKLPYST